MKSALQFFSEVGTTCCSRGWRWCCGEGCYGNSDWDDEGERTCFNAYEKWGCVGIHGRVKEREWEMYIYAEVKRSRYADGLVICALPCQRKDTSGPHLSGQRPYIARHTGQTNKKRKELDPNAKIFTLSGACLHQETKSLQKCPVKFIVKKKLEKNHCKKHDDNIMGLNIDACIFYSL